MTTTDTLQPVEVQRPPRRRPIFLRLVLIVLAAVVVFRGLDDLLPSTPESPSFESALGRADRIEVGKVIEFQDFEVTILEAILLHPDDARVQVSSDPHDPDRFLHLVVTAKVRGDRHLVAYSGSWFGGPEEPRKGTRASELRAVEAWIGFSFVPPNGNRTIRDQIKLRVVALTGRDGGARGPGSHDRSECAEPLNPFDVCELLKSEGRVLGSASIDVGSLGLPSRFLQPR